MNKDSLFQALRACLPQDSSKQSHSRAVAAAWLKTNTPARVLDLGCGDGRSIDFFRANAPAASWIGVDIESSPEVLQRTRTDGEFVTFDGVHLPFADRSIDLVFCHQVFEHVRHPEPLLGEVCRVLSQKGAFIGSTSQLEPYHSFSLWNYTIYGFNELLRSAGMKLVEVRPGIDGITLSQRSYLGRPKAMRKFFSEESPLNQEIEELAKDKSVAIRNYRKLMFCGHFVFRAERI